LDNGDRLDQNHRELWWPLPYPSKRSVEAIKYKANNLTTRSTTHLSLRTLLLQANSVLRGWATYFRYDASKRTLACVDYFAWWQVFRWLQKKRPK
jgi:RNA-directed DNA polymerase